MCVQGEEEQGRGKGDVWSCGEVSGAGRAAQWRKRWGCVGLVYINRLGNGKEEGRGDGGENLGYLTAGPGTDGGVVGGLPALRHGVSSSSW